MSPRSETTNSSLMTHDSSLVEQIERLRARAELFQDWLWTHPQRQSEELYRSVEAERDLLLAEMRRLQRELAATERNSEQSTMRGP